MGKWNHKVSFTHSRWNDAIWQIFIAHCFLLMSLLENATSPWGQSWERVLHKHKCIQITAWVKSKVSFHHSRLLHTAIWQVFFFLLPSITDYCRLTLWMHMLVENATSPCGQSWERIFNKHSCIQFIALVPLALVLWTVCTGACGKPFPKIVPMVKLDIWYLALWQNWCLGQFYHSRLEVLLIA